ncbi:MAG: beta-lactamase family protein [Ruminococcus sp.]|uniref:serine hydrolase domain-containing protein n=1 Tax=Ruminococcus sp. TaxID=41978 RepID=UPI0025DA3789|nr:serine hydrolase domain-containing protein [Ruminococcus sp.]MBR5682588.1 beta-lactamase family protein [Ruminococcus sp.]
MYNKYSKIISYLMAAAMLLPTVSCSNRESADVFSDIKVSGSEQSWANKEEKYSKLIETYGTKKCKGAMAVATDDDIVYLYCEDSAEKDGKTPVSQDTVFDIASVSKTFTAVCILQLQEKGKLSIDDTLGKYFPEYEKGKDITIYNLLHMNSGIPDYLNNPDPFWNISGAEAADKQISDILQDRTTDEQFLEALYNAPLLFEPGTQFSYSNTNYRLLAFIIEQVSGMKYCDCVKKNIFDKCGMKKTTSMAKGDMTYVPVGFEEQAAYGFTDENGYPVCPNNSRGDGGIHSCLSDMIAFDRALFGGKLLNKRSMETLLKDDDGYCCGLYRNKNGYSHDGSSLTCSANNNIIESEEFGYVYLITLERTEDTVQNNADIAEPLKGTGYTKGTVNDGVYVNEYAGIKMTLPEGYVHEGVDLGSAMSGFEEENKRIESAKKCDSLFYDGNGSGNAIEIDFLNTKLGVPDDSDYTEEEYLNDYIDLLGRAGENEQDGWSIISRDISKATLGDKEYIYAKAVIDYHGNTEFHYFARKIDDELMCIIMMSINDDESILDYEKLFG